MKDELTLIAARAQDLYRACLKNGIAAGDFHSPAEQAYMMTFAGRLFSRDALTFFGGYSDAERRVAVFRSDDYRKNLARSRQDAVDWDNIDWEKENWWEQDTPKNAENFDTVTCREACITILRLTVPKGACLPGHRDCLGTLMGMGLERRAVGDIVVQSEAVYLFVKDTVAPYLVSSLDRIGKSPVKAEITETGADFSPCRSFERVTVTLASLRADAIVAAVAGCSREEAKEMVNTGLFTKNYLPLCDPEAHLAEGDVFSIRGKGRFRLLEMAGQTKKGRWKIVLQKYV